MNHSGSLTPAESNEKNLPLPNILKSRLTGWKVSADLVEEWREDGDLVPGEHKGDLLAVKACLLRPRHTVRDQAPDTGRRTLVLQHHPAAIYFVAKKSSVLRAIFQCFQCFSCKNFNFLWLKGSLTRIRIRIGLVPRIRIRIETNADQQHCYFQYGTTSAFTKFPYST